MRYILEVDLKYPHSLNDLHNDYPLCPEKIEVTYDMLSNCCKEIVNWYDIKVGGVTKLIPSLNDKVRYPVHYKNLLYYLSLGMKLVKIHRILSFKQSNWLNVFTDFNSKKRRESSDEFSKDLYKILNNCSYGKSIENIRKRINVKLVNDKKTYQKIVNRPNFIPQKIIDKNFPAVHCSKEVLTLSKPIYTGFCILELSKLLMYQFHYDYVLKTFDNVKLLFTDTDSLVYEIRNDNIYEQCFKDKNLFDFSGYSKFGIYFDDSNKKVLGKMKDEFNGIKIDEFVNRPNFIPQKIIDKNFLAVHCSKEVLTLSKPIYTGFCILELSKLLMYQFHYDYVLKTFDNVKLLFTDTDSLVYEIRNDNIYEKCFKDKNLFDFSGYSKYGIYFDDSNKKVLGKMKDEFNGIKIDEFVGLKSKMYSLLAENNLEVNKAKGVNLMLKYKEYADVLSDEKIVRHKMKRILSEKHSVGTHDINK